MTDTFGFAEIDGQHVELLPARTVLSQLSPGGCGCEGDGHGAGSHGDSGHSGEGGNGGIGGAGGTGIGGIGANL